MKVLHFTETLPGGIATYLNDVVPFQIRCLGLENVHVAAPVEESHHLSGDWVSNLIPFAKQPRSLTGILGLRRSLEQAIAAVKPDVVHLHSTFAGIAGRVPTIRSAFIVRPSIVYCAHGWAFGMKVGRMSKFSFGVAEAVLSLFSDRIICISGSELSLALEYRLPTRKMAIVYNGISTKLDDAIVPIESRKGPLVFTFVGRHDRQKGLDILLDAFAALPSGSAVLNVIGENVVSHPTMANRNNEGVVFHGWLSAKDVQHAVNHSDVVVVPSRWEGFGLVALEAMRSGRAVIASRVGGLEEIVQHNLTGLLVGPADTDELTQALLNMTRDTAAKMGLQGRKRFLEHFTADQMNSAILEEYKLAASSARI